MEVEDKTITDNEVIARFMGGKPSEYHMPKGTYIFFDQLYHGQQLHAYKKMKYSTSWDWLMPVWYKFRDLQFRTFGHNSDWIEHCGYISDAILNKGISETFSVLVEAIKWYNSLKK